MIIDLCKFDYGIDSLRNIGKLSALPFYVTSVPVQFFLSLLILILIEKCEDTLSSTSFSVEWCRRLCDRLSEILNSSARI